MSSLGKSESPVDLDRSVFVRGDLDAKEILAFVKNWKDISVLQACRFVKKELFELTFHSQASADLFMDLGFSVRIGDKRAELRPANNRRKKIHISGLPGSFKEPLLRKYLQELGSLESLVSDSYDDDFSTVATGNWSAIIVSQIEPPPNIHMGEYTARLAFAGQRKLCWDCHSQHPKSAKCPAPKCRNCFKTGHLIASCPGLCSKCSGTHPLDLDCKLRKFLSQLPSNPIVSTNAPTPTPPSSAPVLPIPLQVASCDTSQRTELSPTPPVSSKVISPAQSLAPSAPPPRELHKVKKIPHPLSTEAPPAASLQNKHLRSPHFAASIPQPDSDLLPSQKPAPDKVIAIKPQDLDAAYARIRRIGKLLNRRMPAKDRVALEIERLGLESSIEELFFGTPDENVSAQ